MKTFFKSAYTLLKDSASQWSDDKASRLAAALSYYTIFSIAPLLVLAIAVAGLAFGKEAATNQIFYQIRGLVGDQGAAAIQTMVENVSQQGGGILATVVGLGTLLLGASGAFGQLQEALNSIWQVQPKPGQGVKGFVRLRLVSFSMVLVIGFMLLVTLVISAALAGMGHFLEGILPVPAVVLQMVNFLISFAVTALLFTLIYKVLPDVTVKWKDVWVGGVVTALLFSLGRYLIGLYLGRGSVSSAYGAAGSLVIILLWIYYSAQILFFGAEFTKVYANTYGSHIKPSPHAEPVTAAIRAQEGLEPGTPSPHTAVPTPPASKLPASNREAAPAPKREVRSRQPILKKPFMLLVYGTAGYSLWKRLFRKRLPG